MTTPRDHFHTHVGSTVERAAAMLIDSRKIHRAEAQRNLLPRDHPDTEVRTVDERSIGEILVAGGKLRSEDTERVLDLQKREGIRFGEAAIRLGLLSPADIQLALSRQFAYPLLDPRNDLVSREVTAAFQPFAPPLEALRTLRTQLMLQWFGREQGKRRTLAIVSPARQEGRTYLAANLAVAFAQLGLRTLLIDADLRHPRVAQLFGVDSSVGLSSMLSGRAHQPSLQSVPSLPSLALLPSGATPPNPQELLSRPAFEDLLTEAADRFDVTLVDTSAAHNTVDAKVVSARCGGSLMVTRKSITRAKHVAALKDELQATGVSVLGAVLNEC
jgi:protein-tyrosine kinase